MWIRIPNSAWKLYVPMSSGIWYNKNFKLVSIQLKLVYTYLDVANFVFKFFPRCRNQSCQMGRLRKYFTLPVTILINMNSVPWIIIHYILEISFNFCSGLGSNRYTLYTVYIRPLFEQLWKDWELFLIEPPTKICLCVCACQKATQTDFFDAILFLFRQLPSSSLFETTAR